MKAGAQPQPTQPPSVTTSSSVTIGHYVLGKSHSHPLNPHTRQGSGQGHLWPCEAGNAHSDWREGKDLAELPINLRQVAVKILEKDKIKDKKDVERITREIKILKKVRHPNVIQLYEVRSAVPWQPCTLTTTLTLL